MCDFNDVFFPRLQIALSDCECRLTLSSRRHLHHLLRAWANQRCKYEIMTKCTRQTMTNSVNFVLLVNICKYVIVHFLIVNFFPFLLIIVKLREPNHRLFFHALQSSTSHSQLDSYLHRITYRGKPVFYTSIGVRNRSHFSFQRFVKSIDEPPSEQLRTHTPLGKNEYASGSKRLP